MTEPGSSSSQPKRAYDVFLSFRGADTRYSFTDHLYNSLVRAGIHTFRDDNELPRGEDMSKQLLKAIRESKISIVVFSKGYASSRWCLDELVEILECKNRNTDQIVLPIFYGIDPSDVRRQTGSFANAFAEHEERFKERVKEWRKALEEAGNLSGWSIYNMANGHESKLIQVIIDVVVNKLDIKQLSVAKYVVGIDPLVDEINVFLRTTTDDVRIVGIHGMEGIGKTTIAKVVFDKLCIGFQGSCFLFNVRDRSEQPNGLILLQEQLLCDILKQNNVKINNVDGGIVLIKERLCQKRVLVVLDDVTCRNQLDALMGERNWFGPRSRVIITTRDARILLEVDQTYQVQELKQDQALKLFNWHAFRHTDPAKDYVQLSNDVVNYCGGLPLALVVIGSFLFNRSILEWKCFIDKLQKIPDHQIQKKLKISMASSDNFNYNTISTSLQEVLARDEVDNLTRDEGMIQMESQGTEQAMGEGRTSRAEAGNHMDVNRSIIAEEIIGDAGETKGEASEAMDRLSSYHLEFILECILPVLWSMDDAPESGQRTEQVDQLSEQSKAVDILAENRGRIPIEVQGIEHGVGEERSSNLEAANDMENTSETRGDPFFTSFITQVGHAFEKNTNLVWSWLMDDGVASIGIYGMGGVGKTTMLQHIYNQLLEGSDIYQNVYWVTVPQDFNISRLQYLIAKCLDLDLASVDNELYGSFKLARELKKKQKWILILDDLWNSFELDQVGIPFPAKGCKLIVTTRSKEVCVLMNCKHKIKVELLSSKEAWTLFMEKLGHDTRLSPEVKKVAQSITNECGGLPLGIIIMAGTMKGVDDIGEWMNALDNLRIKQDKMEEYVFRILRFSYVHLNNSALQQCFLYCALFPGDFEVDRDKLIGYLIDERVIERMKNRQAEFDQGHVMLDKLQNVCLLERGRKCGDAGFVRMHDLVREFALQIQEGNSEVMVKAGAQLKELPDAQDWTANLARVSLMQNQIEEIPPSHSPWCPSLSTLFLCHNELRFIADSFFKQLLDLKVLDLSYTWIRKLPDSVSDMVNLSALLLISCVKLRHVPSLIKLRVLERLDLSNTALEKMPQGMECLSNLRYLRLNGCGHKEFPTGILPQLSHLQVLVIEDWVPDENGFREHAPVIVKAKEVACLKKLETLECHFEDHSDLAEFVESRDENQSLVTHYNFTVGKLDEDDM